MAKDFSQKFACVENVQLIHTRIKSNNYKIRNYY